MILYLMHFLSSQLGWKVPTVFSYYSTRMMLAAVTSLLLTIILGPFFIKKLYEWKIGHTVRVKDCPVLAKQYTKNPDTPTMGGLLILTAILIAGVLWLDFTSVFSYILLFTIVWLGALGAIDDYLKLRKKNSKGLSAKKKFFFQVLLAGILSAYILLPTGSTFDKGFFSPPKAKEKHQLVEKNREQVEEMTLSSSEYARQYYIPFYKKPIVVHGVLGALAFLLVTIVVITGSSNAVNLTDGLDGLAAGCLLFVTLVLTVIAFLSNNIELSRYLNILYIEGSGEIGVFLSSVMGACLGFLWYNGYPAQVFMGDTGSLALGGVLGVSAVLLRREFLYAMVAGVFVAETVSVILQVASFKFRGGKRVFLCAPLHHHYECKGWPETKIVVRFWMVGLILALFGLVSLKMQ